MGTGDDQGFGEGFQSGFQLDDAAAFTRLMFELYDWRCAITGERFPPGEELLHPSLEVFLFIPLGVGGLLSFHNAIVVEHAAARLLYRGLVVISDDYCPVVVESGKVGPRLHLPTDKAFWPACTALQFHRQTNPC